jgi:preprotein translocase subunit SecG
MDILTTIIIVVHVIVSLALIVLILLHAGRGGGMSDLFGGGMGPAAAMSGSTVVERNLDRLTVITGLTFTVTTMLLSWLLGR